MVYSPFDFNEATRHREEYVEDRLRQGSPIVGVSGADGVYVLTVRRTQRKVFEIYDRLVFSAIGKQADIERIRTAAIDVAHREGFERSPDDVTAQRLVGFALSPALRQLFGEQLGAPAVIRALFGEMGAAPDVDRFYVLNYDGEFTVEGRRGVVAGTPEAEDAMVAALEGLSPDAARDDLLSAALRAWGAGTARARQAGEADADDPEDADRAAERLLKRELAEGHLEVGLLDRRSTRETRFRLLTPEELETVTKAYR